MEIEIFHQQKQLRNIQTCVIMLGKRKFIIYIEILVYNNVNAKATQY